MSYGEPTSVSETHCTRVASDGVHSARITLYWFIVPSHENIDRRSRQHRCSRLNTSQEVMLQRIAWLIDIVVLNASVILREYGERLYTMWINVPNLIENFRVFVSNYYCSLNSVSRGVSNRSKSQWCVTEYVQYLWVLKSRKYVISQQGRYPNYDGWRRSNHHQHVERSTSMGIGLIIFSFTF